MKNLKYFIPFILTALFFILFACSCNMVKDLKKTKEETKTDTETVTNTTKLTTEKADSVFTLKGDTVLGHSDNLEITPIIEFKDGLELIVTEDPKTHKVSARAIKQPEKIHLMVNRVTAQNGVSYTNTKSDFKNSTSDLHKEVTGGFNWNWLWLIIAGIIAFLFWRFFKPSR